MTLISCRPNNFVRKDRSSAGAGQMKVPFVIPQSGPQDCIMIISIRTIVLRHSYIPRIFTQIFTNNGKRIVCFDAIHSGQPPLLSSKSLKCFIYVLKWVTLWHCFRSEPNMFCPIVFLMSISTSVHQMCSCANRGKAKMRKTVITRADCHHFWEVQTTWHPGIQSHSSVLHHRYFCMRKTTRHFISEYLYVVKKLYIVLWFSTGLILHFENNLRKAWSCQGKERQRSGLLIWFEEAPAHHKQRMNLKPSKQNCNPTNLTPKEPWT